MEDFDVISMTPHTCIIHFEATNASYDAWALCFFKYKFEHFVILCFVGVRMNMDFDIELVFLL